jgi:hypothetical protein
VWASSLADGLILHYRFNESTNDLSRFENDGLLRGGASLVVDKFWVTNSALLLINQGEYLESHNPLPDSESVTVSLWAELASWANRYDLLAPQVLFFEGDDVPGRDLACFISGGFYFTTKGGESLMLDSWLPPDRTWFHLVCIADAQNDRIEIWVDGERRKAREFSSAANIGNHSNFNLGRRPGAFNDWFATARYDDVRVYDRALMAHEVKELYRSEVGVLKQIELEIASVRLKLRTETGKAYILQVTSDFKTWRDLTSVIATEGFYDVEVEVEDGERFFRLWEQR